MRLVSIFSTIRNIIYFDEKSYSEQNRYETDAILSQKHDKKALQLIICGGGIGAGIVAAPLTGTVSILCSALSARHANVLRQQQKILSDIQQARNERQSRSAAAASAGYAPFPPVLDAHLDASSVVDGDFVVVRRCLFVVPRPLSRYVRAKSQRMRQSDNSISYLRASDTHTSLRDSDSEHNFLVEQASDITSDEK